MTIIERLQQHKDLQPYKIALIVDEEQYTYGQLYDAIISMEFNNTSRIINLGQFNDGQKNKVLLTQSLSFVEQLLQWLWGLYKGYIPMVCHNEMDVAYIDELARIISVEGVLELRGAPNLCGAVRARGESSLIFKTISFT